MPRIKLLAWVTDRTDAKTYGLIEFPHISCRRLKVKLPRSTLSSPKKTFEALLDAGLTSAPAEGPPPELIDAINSRPPKTIIIPSMPGWQNRQTYCSPNGVIGALKSRSGYWAKPSLSANLPAPVGQAGDVQRWTLEVASPCLASSAALASLCAAFGAVLLKWVDGTPFIINLSGPSKSGKTTLLLTAASVGGIHSESLLPNLTSSDSALYAMPAAFNDQAFPLNELGLIPGGKRRVYHVIRTIIYAIAEGRDRTLNPRSPYAKSMRQARYKTIGLMTAEQSIAQYAIDAAAVRDGGEFARVVDIDVRRGPHRSILDRCGPGIAADNDVAAFCRRLRDAISQNHGVALPEFVRHLLGMPKGLTNRVRALQEEFVASVNLDQLSDAWRHSCENFGILYAGGVLASEAHLLPIEPNELRNVLGAVFRDAANANPSGNAAAINGQPTQSPRKLLGATLQGLKQEGKLVEHVPGSAFKSGLAGYWMKDAGRIVYTMHTASLRKALGSDDRLDAVLCFLRDRKALIGQKSSNGLKGSLLQQCETSPRWPDGRNVRSIVFFRRIRSPRKTS